MPRRSRLLHAVAGLVLATSVVHVSVAQDRDAQPPDGGPEAPPSPGSSSAEPSDEARQPPLRLEIDRAKVDLEARQFVLVMSRPAKKVRVRVLDVEGGVIAEQEIPFGGEPAGTPLQVAWTPVREAPVARVEVWGYDTSGYWAGMAIIPWSIRIPHEEVLFDTGKAVIKPAEESKLEASFALVQKALAKHRDLGPIALFIAGHTDTVGSEASNMTLSRMRAKAIAAWFGARGLAIPVAYAGFGESVPAVKTADGVDEPRNRRVDYILAIEPPRIRKSGEPARWQRSQIPNQ